MYGCVGTCALYGILHGKSSEMLSRHAAFGEVLLRNHYFCDCGARRGRVRGHGAWRWRTCIPNRTWKRNGKDIVDTETIWKRYGRIWKRHGGDTGRVWSGYGGAMEMERIWRRYGSDVGVGYGSVMEALWERHESNVETIWRRSRECSLRSSEIVWMR